MSKRCLSACFFILSLFLCQPVLIAKQKRDVSRNKKAQIWVKNEHVDVSGEYFEDIVGNTKKYVSAILKNIQAYPKLFTSLMAGGIGYSLYRNDIEKLTNDAVLYAQENKKTTLGVSCAVLVAAYLCKDTLFQKSLEYLQSEDEDEGEEKESGSDGEMSMYSFSKSAVRVYHPGEIKTRFTDVAGLETAKEELADIVMFLKDSIQFQKIGAKIPKGILLSGTPGNGKTLLARALAGEVQCPFLYVSASEFIEAIVGVGAARVRSMFTIAKELAPCIIFIDEIDAIGRKRGANVSGGDTELAQTLNQLLSEMDGFEQQKNPIVIMGATNRSDILDNALLRPGRFDRKIEIASPFVKDRYKILKLHLKNIKAMADLDIHKIARGTPGYSGAELAQLVNEAAILALRQGKKEVSMLHIDQARDNINLGRETKGMDISEQEYWQTAVHEAGHAIALVYQKHGDPLHKVTITPRNGALGITFSMPKERCSTFIENLRAQIVFALGGSVAEEIMYQGRGVGARSDLKKARSLATQMVMHYGMTEEFKDVTFEQYINCEVHLPDALSAKLQAEVSKIIKECRKEAYDIVFNHKKQLEKLVEMLLEQGTVYGSDVYKLCGLEEPTIEYSLIE